MRYFVFDGVVRGDDTYRINMFDISGMPVTITSDIADTYKNICQSKKFFTEPYIESQNLCYLEFKRQDTLKHLNAQVPKQVIGTDLISYYCIYGSSRKLDEIIIDNKLLVFGGQSAYSSKSDINRYGYYIRGKVSCIYQDPPVIEKNITAEYLRNDYHYSEGSTGSGAIYSYSERCKAGSPFQCLSEVQIGNTPINDARSYLCCLNGYNSISGSTDILSHNIYGGKYTIKNDIINNDTRSDSLTTAYTNIDISSGLKDFVPSLHSYCISSPNPFYNIFNKDGTLIKSDKMPLVEINNFNHVISPSYMSRVVSDNNSILVGGYISKISHCYFTVNDYIINPVSHNRSSTNSFILNNSADSGYIWITTTRKVSLMPESATLINTKFTGEHILVSGTNYYEKIKYPNGVEVPFLDSQLSDIIYSCNNIDYTMKIVGRMPKPILGSGLFVLSDNSILVIGGINSCPNTIQEWKNIDGSKDVYKISIKNDIATVTKLSDTMYVHLFPALYKIDTDTILIVSGDNYEVYKVYAGTIQFGNLKFGTRYGSYIHKFVINGVSQFCICGGWKYSIFPYLNTTESAASNIFVNLFGSLYESRTTYNGVVKSGIDDNCSIYIFANGDREKIGGTYIPDNLDTDKDQSKAVYYQIDFNDSILVYNYTLYTKRGMTLSYSVCASNNKIDWYQLDEKIDIILADKSYYLFELKNNTSFRYYRLYIYKTKQTIITNWPPPSISIEFGTDYFKCKVPVHYVGDGDSTNQIEKDGWWRPNLDFEESVVTYDTTAMSAYKNATPSIEWNKKIETISDIYTNEYCPEFIATKYVVMSGDDIVLKIDNLVTQYKSKICYTNQNGTQVEVDINSTSYTLSSNLLQTGLNKIYLYVVKNDSLTYLQCAEFFVNTPVSLTCSNAHPTVGSYIKLNSSFDYGIGTITPGNIHVEPNSSIRIDITSLDTIKYTLTVDLNGIVQTSEITITPSIPTAEPVFTINGFVLEKNSSWVQG